MKSSIRISITAALIAALASFSSCTGEKTYRADHDGSINLGKIKEADGPVTFRVAMKNDMGEAAAIARFRPDCSCTQAIALNGMVEDGEDFLVQTTFNPAYRRGQVKEGVNLRMSNNTMHRFEFIANVIPCAHPIKEDAPYEYGEGLYLSMSVLPYGTKRAGEKGDIYFHLGNDSGKKMNVRFEVEGDYPEAIRMRQPGRLKVDARDTIHVHFTMPERVASGDTLRMFIQPYVNNKPTERKLRVTSIAQ